MSSISRYFCILTRLSPRIPNFLLFLLFFPGNSMSPIQKSWIPFENTYSSFFKFQKPSTFTCVSYDDCKNRLFCFFPFIIQLNYPHLINLAMNKMFFKLAKIYIHFRVSFTALKIWKNESFHHHNFFVKNLVFDVNPPFFAWKTRGKNTKVFKTFLRIEYFTMGSHGSWGLASE